MNTTKLTENCTIAAEGLEVLDGRESASRDCGLRAASLTCRFRRDKLHDDNDNDDDARVARVSVKLSHWDFSLSR